MTIQPGERVRLIHTDDQFTRLQPGTEGTVSRVRGNHLSGYSIDVNWDDGSSLTMLPDEGDDIEVIR